MAQDKTVYDFAKHCMNDANFQVSGIPTNERKWLDAIGFEYTVKDGCISNSGEDLSEFYNAMCTLLALNNKYAKSSK